MPVEFVTRQIREMQRKRLAHPVEKLAEIRGPARHKVVIFSQFVMLLDRVREGLRCISRICRVTNSRALTLDRLKPVQGFQGASARR